MKLLPHLLLVCLLGTATAVFQIPLASHTPVTLTFDTLTGLMSNGTGWVGADNSFSPVNSGATGPYSLTANGIFISDSYMAPTSANLIALSAFFSLNAPVEGGAIALTITAQLWTSPGPTPTDTFEAVNMPQSAAVNMVITGNPIAMGATASGMAGFTGIPIVAGTRVIMVVSAKTNTTVGGMIMGTFSGGLGFAP